MLFRSIEEARPFEDLTVSSICCGLPIKHLLTTSRILAQAEDVGKAHPRIVEAVETMMKKGKWTVPGTYRLPYSSRLSRSPFRHTGYKEKFGDLSLM